MIMLGIGLIIGAVLGVAILVGYATLREYMAGR